MTARARVAALAAAVALVALPLGGGAPAGAVPCAAARALGDGWTRLAAPPFTVGGGTLAGYDVAPAEERLLAATNGSQLAASTDGGCAWRLSVVPGLGPLGDVDSGETYPGVDDDVSQVRFAPGPAPALWAIGTMSVTAGGRYTTRPRVLFSGDGGARFTLAGNGLPPLARPVAIRGLGGTAAVLLLRTPLPVEEYAFYVTRDGVTWAEHWGDVAPLADFAVDTVSTQGRADPVVWAWNSTGVHLARLGDDRLRRLPEVNGHVSAVDLALVPGRPATAHVYFTGAAERSVSADGGATFAAAPAPAGVRSAATYQPLPNVRALATGRRVLVEIGPRTLDVTPRGARVGDVRFVAARPAAGMPLYAAGATTVYRRYVALHDGAVPPLPPPPVDVRVSGREGLAPAPPSISPRRAVVRLRRGERRTVTYRVALPPVPKPLDVFFVTDSTPSMRTTIASVQQGVQGIVDGLTAAGIAAQFGLGDFRDFPRDERDDANYPYQRLRAVGPVDTELAEALEAITTGGGNGTGGHHAGLEAIYQAVTGAGRLDRFGARVVRPGRAARFRPDAMKVVVVATDDGFRTPGPDDPAYPGPGPEQVSEALRRYGVFLVGLDVRNAEPGSGRAVMERLAADTGAVAPRGGVDCDGDRTTDLAAGEPLVCDFAHATGETIAAAFVAMLASITETAAVDLSVAGGAPYVRPLGSLHHAGVNVRVPNTFTLPVEFRCTAANAGTVTPVRVAVGSRGTELAAATASFECLAPDLPGEPAAPPVPPQRVAVALVPPPPPPPAPVPHGNPNPNPNPQPHPNPNPNPNPGVAAQDGQQHELALADGRARVDDELAMIGLDRRGPPLPALAWAAAVAMTGAAAYGLRPARRPRTAPALGRSRAPRAPRRPRR